MITRETAARIWECYREIETAKKLLDDMDAAAKECELDVGRKHAEKLRDAFGRERDLQLGIPSGDSCHRLFNVSPRLARSVIKAHVETKRAELIEANEQARIELGDFSSTDSEKRSP